MIINCLRISEKIYVRDNPEDNFVYITFDTYHDEFHHWEYVKRIKEKYGSARLGEYQPNPKTGRTKVMIYHD